MSWYKICVLVLALMNISGCEFRPVFGGANNAVIHNYLSNIDVVSIKERYGQVLHNHLLDRLNPLGRSGSSQYTLKIKPTLSKEEIGFRFTEEATRARIKLSVEYYLHDNISGIILTKGSGRSVNNYNVSDSGFSQVIAEKEASERAAREISHEIKNRLSLFFAQSLNK